MMKLGTEGLNDEEGGNIIKTSRAPNSQWEIAMMIMKIHLPPSIEGTGDLTRRMVFTDCGNFELSFST